MPNVKTDSPIIISPECTHYRISILEMIFLLLYDILDTNVGSKGAKYSIWTG